MIRPDEPDEALAAEYVIGLLETEARRTLERRMAQEPAFAARVERWEDRLSGLNRDYGDIAPRALVKTAIDRRLFAQPRRTAWLWGWFGALAAAAAALVVFVWQVTLEADQILRAELGTEDQPAQITIRVDADRDQLGIDLLAAAPPPGSVFELWLVPDGEPPTSLGTFSNDADLPLGIETELLARTTLAVSIEPAGGSPTGLPTGPVIATGVLQDA